MKIERARQLKHGERVRCPADRGDPAYVGTVCDESELLAKAAAGKVYSTKAPYIWVAVRAPDGRKALWPSNRLGAC